MNQRLGSDTIRAIASVIWVLFLSGRFILTTDQLADEGVYPETVAMGVWMGLMIVQIMIWGLVAYINWGIYSRLRQYAGSVSLTPALNQRHEVQLDAVWSTGVDPANSVDTARIRYLGLTHPVPVLSH